MMGSGYERRTEPEPPAGPRLRVYELAKDLNLTPKDLVAKIRAMGMEGIDRSQVSRLCAEIDGRVRDFLARPIEGDWPYLWLDATYAKVREAGRIVPVAVTIAVGVNADGRREVLGMDIGPSEAETFWTAFLRKLARRGLRRCEARRLRRS